MNENMIYMKSTTLTNEHSSTIVISEKDGCTGVNELKIINNPIKTFWVTKPNFRNHKDRKEYEYMSKLDRYDVPEHESVMLLSKALGMRYPNNSMRRIKNTQYVYGWDIPIDTITKINYRKNNDQICKLHIGVIDIETSVLGDNQIIIVTYIDITSGAVHTHILESFMQGHTLAEIDKFYKLSYDKALLQLKSMMQEKHTETCITYLESGKLNYHRMICKDEQELLITIMGVVNSYKPDYVIGWNLEYDITKIHDRGLYRGIRPANLFCHDDVPDHLRVYNYKPKKLKPGQHITDRWVVPTCTGYTDYIDYMCLYGRLRVSGGRDISYTLDYISDKELGLGKLDIEEGNTHYKLQSEFPVEYVGYNIFDVLLLVLMEIKNRDMYAMVGNLGDSVVKDLASQTVRGRDTLYTHWMSRSMMISTSIGNQSTEYDKFLIKQGGTVLDPKQLSRGLAIIKGSSQPTRLWKPVSDIDVSSQYPSTAMEFNISKETKLETIYHISGFGPEDSDINWEDLEEGTITKQKKERDKLKIRFDHIEDFMLGCVFEKENAVGVCNKFYKLPNYIDMKNTITKGLMNG